MSYLIGDGLPSTLTPGRIKGVLQFAKTQERAFADALERVPSSGWKKTEPSGDFYTRLHVLLSTSEGRTTYESAKKIFEGEKRKRYGRADLPGRLIKVCLESAPSSTEPGFDHLISRPNRDDYRSALAQTGKWDLLAEFVWAQSVTLDSGDYLLDALERHPETATFLEDVRAGLRLVSNRSEEPNPTDDKEGTEATALVEKIKERVSTLNAGRMDLELLQTLDQHVGRLIKIAEAREAQRRNIEQLRSRISAWREAYSEALADAQELATALGKLEAWADTGNIDQQKLEEVLHLFETAFDTDVSFKQKRAALAQAFKDEDYTLVSSLGTALESLKANSEKAHAVINSAVSRSQCKGPAPTERHTSEAVLDARSEEATEGAFLDTNEIAPEPRNEAVPPTDQADLESTPNEKVEVLDEAVTIDHAFESSSGDAGESDRAPTDTLAVVPPTMSEHLNEENDRTAASRRDGVVSPEEIESAIATALEHDRFGVAYHLALSAPDALPRPETITFIASSRVTDGRDSLVADLMNCFGSVRRPEASRVDYVALAAGAALIPAQIAPGWLIADLLSSLEPSLDAMLSLRELVKVAAEVSRIGVHLPAKLLRGDASPVADWTERAELLQKEATHWIAAERQSTIQFAAATKVWHRILDEWTEKKRCSIGRMFRLLGTPTKKIDIEAVKAIAEHWRRCDEDEIDRVDRSIRGTPRQIEGNARLRLREKIREAVGFADRWVNLLQTRPDGGQESSIALAEKLRSTVHGHGQTAIQEVASLDTRAALLARRLVEGYVEMFEDTESGTPSTRLRLQDLLNGDLFADPSVRFDDLGVPMDETLPSTSVLLRFAQQDRLDFQSSIIERAQSGDFGGSEFVLDYVERGNLLDEKDIARARTRVEEERSRAQERLKSRHDKTRNRLDVSYALGILSAEDHDQLDDRLTLPDLSEISDFSPLFDDLDDIEKEIDSSHERFRTKIQKQLEGLDTSQGNRERIKDLINADRFQVADDFIGRIARGDSLPSSEVKADRPFDRFFPDFVEAYGAFRADRPEALRDVQETVNDRKREEYLDATHLSQDAARDGVRLLKAWTALCAGPTTKENLGEFMNALGFVGTHVDLTDARTNDGEAVFDLHTSPITDRNIAQLPVFGSRAQGCYRLLTIRGRDSHEAIVREAGAWTADGHPPNIVLFLNFLDIDARRELAREFRAGDSQPTLVLDEALVTFLSALPGQRQGTFFDCASAFTFSQPFDPDAVEVPPEMFFGRDEERRKILAASGGDRTHFVYGGRRLGKTALFKNIAGEYKSRAPDQLVLFLNLKPTGIGQRLRTDELWRLFTEPLAKHEVVSDGTTRYDTFQASVRQWLEGKPGRRILFLVDEADDFLDADRLQKPPYHVLDQIKQLMEDTDRRFKVVFAGLHNVQRAARDPNTPLAHLGAPVRIGPMLPETDGAEIENLIRAPFEALGYRFHSRDSVIRIAAETNYYPALVQQFCKDLLWVLRERDNALGPPFTILPEQIDHASHSKETRDRIRNLFSWTIQLDSRYEFLAYLIARNSFDDDSTGLGAMSIEAIRETALSEWPQGFDSDRTHLAFEVLLEEMVGLGILRKVGEESHERFVIRTRNLRMLLGNENEIERRFNDAKDRKPHLVFDPSQFRRTLDVNGRRLSSLTAEQEDQLLSSRPGVALLCGTRLAGLDLDRVRDSLVKAVEGTGRSVAPRVVREFPDVEFVRSQLRDVSRSREPGVHFVLVDVRSRWNADLLETVLEFIGTLDSNTRIVRPVLLGGPGEAWEWLKGRRSTRRGKATVWEVWLGPCARGFAYSWLKDLEAQAYSDLENPIDSLWPVVVEVAAESEYRCSVAEAADIVLQEGSVVSDVLDVREAEPVLHLLSELYDARDTIDVDVLSEMSEAADSPVSVQDAISILRWADRLGIVCRHGKGYRLDAAYATGFPLNFNG